MPAWVRPFVTGVLMMVLVSGTVLLLARPGGDTIEILIATPVPGVIGVAVSGEVAHPGVYTLPSGSRVADLLALAGGVTEAADPAVPSRALRLRDEMHIHVPPTSRPGTPLSAAHPTATGTPQPSAAGAPSLPATASPLRPAAGPAAAATTAPSVAPETGEASAAVEASGAPSDLIDLNTASAAELERLPGIGPALAARIVADRTQNGPFRQVNDLVRVSGIGPATLARLRPFVRV